MIKINLGRLGRFDIDTPTPSEVIALIVILAFLLGIAVIAR